MADVDYEIAAGQPKKRTFKKFSFRGVDLDALLDMSTDDLVKLLNARARRRFQRGLKRKAMALIKKLHKAKREARAGEKPALIRTHLRNMIIVPEMIGSVLGVYNGKTFNPVEIKPEMIGHYIAEFSISYKPVKHGRPGLQIKQSKDGVFINQSKYAKNLVKRFGLDSTKPMRTPMGSSDKLCRDDVGIDVDPTLYRGMIGSLLYLTASRPDILFSVGICARYQAKSKESHLKAVKRIIRYVSGTTELGIWYTKDTNTDIVGYSDSDWAGDVDDRQSTSGGCYMLGNNMVSWSSKKHNCVSLSTAESEYIAAASCCSQLLWLRQMLDDYGMKSSVPLVFCGNVSAIEISKNPVQHSRTKHIDIRHHFIRDLVEKELILLRYVPTEDQLADIFTKALDYERFSFLRKSFGISSS